MRLMHIADLHLGAPMRHLADAAEQRRKERDSAFAKMIDVAYEKADILILSGDLFDTHDPAQELVGMVRSQLKRLKDAGIKTIVVPGNHDEITYTASTYNDSAWDTCCTLVKSPRPDVVFEGVVAGDRIFVCSCAYTGGITTAADLKEFPDVPGGSFGILALHATADMDLPGTREDRAMKVSSGDIERAGYSYAALGHIHKGRQWNKGRLTLAYPGIIDAMEFGDGATGEILLAEVTGGAISTRKEKLEGLERYAEVLLDATGLTPEKAAGEIVKQAAGAKYVKVGLTGTVPTTFSAAALDVELRLHFGFLQLQDESLRIDESELSYIAEENSARGIFVKRILALLEAAESPDRPRLIAALRKGLEALRRQVRK